MTPFEDELRRALARRDPPEDFSACVLARVRECEKEQASRRWFPWGSFRWTWSRWTRTRVWALAMALLLSVGAGVSYRSHERTLRGQAAKQKLLLALQIAGSKLHQARQQVREVEAMEIE